MRRPKPSLNVIPGLVVGVCLLSGCNGDSGQDRTERDPDFATYSAADVQKRFKELTGVELRRSGSPDTQERLSLSFADSPTARAAEMRYGVANITVTANKPTLKTITERLASGERKVIDNVVIEGGISSQGDESYKRVVQVLSSLGKPASSAKLPVQDTPCTRAGIDLETAAGKEGTCKNEDQKTVQIVNAGGSLEVSGKTLSGVRVATGKRLATRSYGSPRRSRAKGAYVLVSYKVENTGDEPLREVGATLIAGGQRFSQDDRLSYDVRPDDVFPLQPGESDRTALLFDMPVPAARRAVEHGALEIVAGEELSSPQYAQSVGRIRLGDAPSAGGGLVK